MKEVALFMQRIAEASAEHAGCPVFLTSPRFDQDFVSEIKLVSIDQSRSLAIILTTFGQVFTELLHSPHKLNLHALHRIESYFQNRLRGIDSEMSDSDEKALALRFYQEIMARYLVNYANFSHEELFCTGFSKLLRYPELQEAEKLAAALSLFENKLALRSISRDVMRANQLKCWIGEELNSFLTMTPNCALICAPYHIASKQVGAIGVIGPQRLPYKSLLSLLRSVAAEISRFLERNLYRYKISFREASAKVPLIESSSRKLLAGPKSPLVLEDHHILGIDD
jgi:heat-inducible transcriptional repressor